jgi:hypothetical protein
MRATTVWIIHPTEMRGTEAYPIWQQMPNQVSGAEDGQRLLFVILYITYELDGSGWKESTSINKEKKHIHGHV